MRTARLLLLAALALVGIGLPSCVTPRGADGLPGARDGDRLVQVLHRSARLRTGALDVTAVEAAADAAVQALTGEELPLDAWAAVAAGGDVVVLALPSAGPLARAAHERLRLVGDAQLVERADAVPARARVLLVARPAWRDARAGWGAAPPAGVTPVLALADLFDAAVGADTWRADLVLGATRVELLGAGADYVLGARATGRIPNWDHLARAHGVDPGRVEWIRLALAR